MKTFFSRFIVAAVAALDFVAMPALAQDNIKSIPKHDGNGGRILEAQLTVDGTAGKYPEFKGNVATIYTNPMAQGGSGNGHYGGKAEVYMDVGEAMGHAMVELLKNK